MAIEQDLKASTPQIEFEHVTVSFPSTANQDMPIKTILRPENPANIYYRIVDVQSLAAPTSFCIYRDTSTTAKVWYPGYIFLRCNVASIKVVLELFIKRDKPNA